jgi:prepilin-type N-terminal cleavage/methylation domain-containing protein/prepilin-type processing-associated H-X9-DG protein
MRQRKGFTLVELLVVVAIIAVLISILLPSLGKARSQARRSQCLANVRSIGSALQVYMTDWSAMIPYYTTGNNANSYYWVLLLKPYGNIEKVRQCAECLTQRNGNGVGDASTPWTNYANNTALGTGSYGMNGWCFALGTRVGVTGSNDWYLKRYSIDQNPGTPTPTTSFFWRQPFTRNMAEVPLLGDSINPDGWPLASNAMPKNLQTGDNKTGMGRHAIARHGKSINLAFVDGHAENLPLQQLWTLKWHTQWAPPTPMPTVP